MPASLEPWWPLLVFAVLWFAISALVARLGGWTTLATAFRASGPSAGECFRFVSGSLRSGPLPVHYRGSLIVRVGEAGIGLSVPFAFRAFSPPLFIPWHAIERIEPRSGLFDRSVDIRLAGAWPVVTFRGAAADRVLALYTGLRARS